MNSPNARSIILMAVIFIGLLVFLPGVAAAHCDTLDGPVVADAKTALEQGDVTPVLKWVKGEHEKEIRKAFEKAMAVRAKGPDAKELADMYFFETLVRLHRAGEGAAYAGLKPAGLDLGPAVAGADKALGNGDVGGLVKLVTKDAAAGIRERFNNAMEKKKHADDSVEAGREYVEAYVEFVHYVERLHHDAAGPAAHSAEAHSDAEAADHH